MIKIIYLKQRNYYLIFDILYLNENLSIPCSVKDDAKPFQYPDSFIISDHCIDSLATVEDVEGKFIFPVFVVKHFLLAKGGEYLLEYLD